MTGCLRAVLNELPAPASRPGKPRAESDAVRLASGLPCSRDELLGVPSRPELNLVLLATLRARVTTRLTTPALRLFRAHGHPVLDPLQLVAILSIAKEVADLKLCLCLLPDWLWLGSPHGSIQTMLQGS